MQLQTLPKDGMGRNRSKKNRKTSIPTEDQTKGQIGKAPSLGHFMDLSKDGQSPMIIKKGDDTPPRVPIG